MKKILIPTDLSVRSLNIIHSVVEHYDEPLDIILFHAVQIGSSLNDILFQTRRIGQTLINREYATGCEILKRKYKTQIKRLHTAFFYGSNTGTFNDFAERHQADIIIINELQEYAQPSEFSFDPSELIKRAKCPSLSLTVKESTSPKVTEHTTISELLVSI